MVALNPSNDVNSQCFYVRKKYTVRANKCRSWLTLATQTQSQRNALIQVQLREKIQNAKTAQEKGNKSLSIFFCACVIPFAFSFPFCTRVCAC